jgi:hypothetical protein
MEAVVLAGAVGAWGLLASAAVAIVAGVQGGNGNGSNQDRPRNGVQERKYLINTNNAGILNAVGTDY